MLNRQIDTSKKARPYFLWRRMRVLHSVETVVFSIPDPLVYVITNITAKWNQFGILGNITPVPKVRFYKNSEVYSDYEFPLELMGSPGCRNVTASDVSLTQADLEAQGVAFKSTPLFDKAGTLIPLQMYGVFQVDISGMEVNSPVDPFANSPSHIDLYIEGALYNHVGGLQ